MAIKSSIKVLQSKKKQNKERTKLMLWGDQYKSMPNFTTAIFTSYIYYYIFTIYIL